MAVATTTECLLKATLPQVAMEEEEEAVAMVDRNLSEFEKHLRSMLSGRVII